jgi:hypothetical protein
MLKNNLILDYKTNDKYQEQFLSLFNLDKFDDKYIENISNNTLKLIENDKYIIKTFDKLLNNPRYSLLIYNLNENEKKVVISCVFYSYDYLDIFYNCYQKFINNDKDAFKELYELIN